MKSIESKARAHEQDELTGLPNRYAFNRLFAEISRNCSCDRAGYVVLIDLDDFRKINQGFGYAAGDELMICFAKFLRAQFGQTHHIFRMNSDSFALIGPDETGGCLPADAMITRCCAPWTIGGTQLYCTASISAAYYPESGQTAEEICRNLHSAMCKAKEYGKNKFVFYEEQIENVAEIMLRRHEIERMLRDAVRHDFEGFQLHYQPLYLASADQIIGAEVLVRYESREGVLLSPATFIGIAEERGLIVPIGAYVLREAARLCLAMIDAGYADFCMSVNVSVCQIQEADFAESMLRILDEVGVPYHNMIFEITEGVAALHLERIRETCYFLRERGIQFALDDFGTGYSSLNMIRTMPIDLIKIDKSFVEDLKHEAGAPMFIRLIAHLGQMLGMTVCAEGVEEEAQMRSCRDIGVDFIQGFYCSRPVPAQELVKLMNAEVEENLA